MRINDLLKAYHYVGNCANAFNDEGDCVIHDLYRDKTDFEHSLEDYEPISEVNFLFFVQMPQALRDRPGLTFFKDNDNDILIAFDSAKDIRYFFTRR